MKQGHWSDKLAELDACEEAIEWCTTQPDLATAWATCERSDWLFWLLRKCGPRTDEAKRQYQQIAIEIARSVLHLVPAGEERPRLAIEAAEKYLRGEISGDELIAARRDRKSVV